MQLFEICHEIALSSTGSFTSVLIAIALLAFVGSFSHCTFMCSPFVFSQISQNQTADKPANEWQRLKGAALLPYHAGRITTYGFLGGLSALLGTQISQVSTPFIGSVLLLSGVLMLAYGIWPKHISALLSFKGFANIFSKATQSATNKLSIKPGTFKRYMLGIILGFIPCGMVYIALTAVATAGSFFNGFIAMIIFGISTVPALFTVGMFSRYFTDNLHNQTKWVTSIALVLSGGWLCFIAFTLLNYNQ